VDNPKLTNQANPDALSPAPPASSPPEPLIRDRFLSGMNQVLTILRDLDCPLDVRVTMAHDVADAALRSMLASSPPEPPAERYRTHDDLDGTPRYRWETTEPSPPERSEGSPTLADYAQHRANCALQRWIDRGSVVPRPQCSCGLVGLLNRLVLPPEPSNG
jgi:hypothetical protein